VAYVIDGDTIELGSGERVRLLGIDTPELDECYYQEATDFARDLMNGQSVRLETDVTDRDKYDRLLRHVFVVYDSEEEVHVNYELIENGYAEILPIPPDRAYRAEFRQAERLAEETELGRWGECG
jgi:micrococcal nuclease